MEGKIHVHAIDTDAAHGATQAESKKGWTESNDKELYIYGRTIAQHARHTFACTSVAPLGVMMSPAPKAFMVTHGCMLPLPCRCTASIRYRRVTTAAPSPSGTEAQQAHVQIQVHSTRGEGNARANVALDKWLLLETKAN